MKKLTDELFWEKFWRELKLPVLVDLDFSNDRNIAECFSLYLGKDPNKSAIEIGCAPGKWMIYMRQKYGYKVDGVEYCQPALKKTRENLHINGMDGAFLYEGDFTKIKIDKHYDVVIGLGFIEHFIEQDTLFDKMLSLLKSNGRLVIGVPNFTGINYYIAKYLDKRKDLLAGHNLSVMNLGFYKKMADKYGLKIVYFDYLGPFEPALFEISINNKILSKAISLVLRLLTLLPRSIIFDQIFSGYIMAIYEKK